MRRNIGKQCIECWGDYAFFGNSTYGANRWAYEYPTPANVIGIFESIYWKPCFRWIPEEIQILAPIKYMSFVRNELRSRTCDVGQTVYHIELGGERVQRCDRILKDVKYRFIAHIDYDPEKETAPGSNYTKHVEMFERRAKKGQCFHQPFFGSKEFPAHFRWVDLKDEKEVLRSEDLYTPKQRGIQHYGFDRSEFGGKPIPMDYIPYVSGGRVFISAGRCQEECVDAQITNECQPYVAYKRYTKNGKNKRRSSSK